MKRGFTIAIISLWTALGVQNSTAIPKPVLSLKQGVFLFSIPELRDPNFFHSVVLLINYEKAGAMGVIINKPTEYSLKEVLPDLEETEGQSLPLYFGGPVSRNTMLILFRSDKPPKQTTKVFKDVYFTGSKEVLTEILKKQGAQKRVRAYAGYAGWAPGQLEHEVSRGDWVISHADEGMIFSEDSSKVWPEIFKIQDQIEIKNSPANRLFPAHQHEGHPKT